MVPAVPSNTGVQDRGGSVPAF